MFKEFILHTIIGPSGQQESEIKGRCTIHFAEKEKSKSSLLHYTE